MTALACASTVIRAFGYTLRRIAAPRDAEITEKPMTIGGFGVGVPCEEERRGEPARTGAPQIAALMTSNAQRTEKNRAVERRTLEIPAKLRRFA